MAENRNATIAELNATLHQLAEMVDALSERLSKLEQVTSAENIQKIVQRASGEPVYHETTEELENISFRIPDKFSAKDLPIFQPMDDPRFHLKGFRAITSLKGIDASLLPKIFPLSLDPVCQKWFYSLPDKETATWEDITHAFMTRYKSNIENSTSRRELEILKQNEEEGFTTFLTRWKRTAAQIVQPPTEAEMIDVFIDNLQPKYGDHLRYLGLESFDKVYKIGIQIENDALKEEARDN